LRIVGKGVVKVKRRAKKHLTTNPEDPLARENGTNPVPTTAIGKNTRIWQRKKGRTASGGKKGSPR